MANSEFVQVEKLFRGVFLQENNGYSPQENFQSFQKSETQVFHKT